eukprot:Pgem_evm1s10998
MYTLLKGPQTIQSSRNSFDFSIGITSYNSWFCYQATLSQRSNYVNEQYNLCFNGHCEATFTLGPDFTTIQFCKEMINDRGGMTTITFEAVTQAVPAQLTIISMQ